MEPYDEQDLLEDDIIIRRINPHQHVVPDENTGRRRLSSKAFSSSSGHNGGMSIDIPKLMEANGVIPSEFVTNPQYTGSVSLKVLAVREQNLWIGYEPLDKNPYHGEVWKNPNGGKFTKGQKAGLQGAASWFVEVPGVDLR